ncbi:CHAT domain-containing protein, partial [Actinotalea sp. K2]|nr:CHAT domain-containing protein [Actinotalea sp. K2]
MRVDEVLDVLARGAPAEVAVLRTELPDDPTAKVALREVVDASLRLVATGLGLVVDLKRLNRLDEMQWVGRELGDLAHGLGEWKAAAVLYLLGSDALRQLNKLWDTADVCAKAVAAAAECDPVPRDVMAGALQNWGVVLAELGEFDDAIEKLRSAGSFEDDPGARTRVDNALAGAVLRIGEFDSAIRLFKANLEALEVLDPAKGLDRGLALDALASAYQQAGDLESAAVWFDEARKKIAADDVRRRYGNARGLAEVNAQLGNLDLAGLAFVEARELAVLDVRERQGPDRLRAGLRAGIERLVDDDTPTWKLVLAAEVLARASGPAAAVPVYERAANAAAAAGDPLTAFGCRVHIAHGLLESGEEDLRAIDVMLTMIRAEALAAALPSSAALADVGLMQLLHYGLEESACGLDRFYLACEALALDDLVQRSFFDSADVRSVRIQRANVGVPYAALAEFAEECGALEVAADHLFRAVSHASQSGDALAEVIGAGRILALLDRRGASSDASETTIRRIRELIERPDASAETRKHGYYVLGRHTAITDPRAALDELRRAAAIHEQIRMRLRAQVAMGDPRTLREDTSFYPELLRAMIDAAEPDADAFDVLQRTRALALGDQLELLRGGRVPHIAANNAEAVRLLARLPVPTTLVDVTSTSAGLRAYLVDEAGVRSVDAEGPTWTLEAVQYGDVRRRAAEVVALTRSSVILRHLVEAVEDSVEPERALLVVLDDHLANLPIHAVPLRGGVWSDARSIGRIPAVAVLRYSPNRPWAGKAVVAGDSRGDLPHAAVECRHVAETLDARPLLQGACSFEALKTRLTETQPDVVHLALHGRADVRRGGRASLLFANGAGRTTWAGFDELAQLPWQASLIVFSGCSTAVGGPRHGRGIHGVAQAALAAGATATVASLWPVDDQSTRVFMTEFYDEFARARGASDWVDLRLVMDGARAHLRQRLAERVAGCTIRDGRSVVFDDEIEPSSAPGDEEEALMMHWAP